MPIARIIYYSQNYLCSYNPWLALRVRNPFCACFFRYWTILHFWFRIPKNTKSTEKYQKKLLKIHEHLSKKWKYIWHLGSSGHYCTIQITVQFPNEFLNFMSLCMCIGHVSVQQAVCKSRKQSLWDFLGLHSIYLLLCPLVCISRFKYPSSKSLLQSN